VKKRGKRVNGRKKEGEGTEGLRAPKGSNNPTKAVDGK